MNRFRGFILCSVLLSVSTTSFGRIWRVYQDGSGDIPTIQAGIDTASSGDTVLVSPGTFNEQINFRGKGIVVKSDLGPSGTIIDASPIGGDVVTFSSGETRSAVLSGFKITGGSRGILIAESQPTILNNVISGNAGATEGAGICCGGADVGSGPWKPLISGNVISSNIAQWNGGGVCVFQVMVPEILNNEIKGNTASLGDGGGIWYLSFFDGGVIRGNILSDNFAGDHGGGFYAGSSLLGSPVQFDCSWNLVVNNTANGREATGNSGGGLWMWETSATVSNNTIVSNTGNGPWDDYGGGVVLDDAGTPIIERNIIALSSKGGGLWCGDGATPVIMNNLAWQNVGSDGVGTCADWWMANGNVIADPQFCDVSSGNFYLAENSPAFTHPSGPLGALIIPGCAPIRIKTASWGTMKARYIK